MAVGKTVQGPPNLSVHGDSGNLWVHRFTDISTALGPPFHRRLNSFAYSLVGKKAETQILPMKGSKPWSWMHREDMLAETNSKWGSSFGDQLHTIGLKKLDSHQGAS